MVRSPDRLKSQALESYQRWTTQLRQLRQERGWRQQDVARQVQFSRSQYCAIERGYCLATYLHLFKLAKVFGVSLPELMTLRPTHRGQEPESGRLSASRTRKRITRHNARSVTTHKAVVASRA